MKSNLTEVVFILDRSGSMYDLTDETIGGFNAFVDKQKQDEGETLLTTVLFDDKYEILHNGVNIKNIAPMTTNEYWARGYTALYDAIGRTINDVGARLAATAESERPSHVIFVITTDGYENGSREFTQAKVREMIEHQTDKYNWEFLFLGANIDSRAVGTNIGIKATNTANFTASSVGVDSVFRSVDCAVSELKSVGTVPTTWSDSLR